MGMEEAIGEILIAKDQKPMLFEISPLEYDFHDIDGLYYMLDRKLSGCLLLMWTKPMDPNAEGTVLLDGVPVDGCVSQYMAVMGNMWVLGIPLRGRGPPSPEVVDKSVGADRAINKKKHIKTGISAR